MKDSPKWLVVASIFLAVITLSVGWIGFHRMDKKHSPKPRASAQESTASSTQAKDCQCERCTPQAERRRPYIDVINKAMQLFFANSNFEDYDLETFPRELTFATITGYAAVLSLTIWAFMALLKQFCREKRLSGLPFLAAHPAAVVFNLPESFRHLIPELANKHIKKWGIWSTKPVVIVVTDLESPLATACKRAGLWVIEASSFDKDFLDRAAVARSREIYIFGDQYTANLDLALRCQELFPKHPPSASPESIDANAYEIHVAVEDSDVLYALQPHTLGEALSHATILPFSFEVNAARKALSNGRLATLPTGQETGPFFAQTTHVLMGSGRHVRAFFAEIIKNSVIKLDERPTLHVISPDAKGLESRLRAEIPAWNLLHANILFHLADDSQPEAFIQALTQLAFPTAPNDTPWNFYCLLEDDGSNLSLAARLAARLAEENGAPSSFPVPKNVSRILFRCREADVLSKQFAAFHKPGLHMEPLGELTTCASLDMIRQESSLRVAGIIHQGYKLTSLLKDELKDRPHALAAFQKLTLVKREQNFAQVAHAKIKIAQLGPLFTSMHEFLSNGGDDILFRILSHDSNPPSVALKDQALVTTLTQLVELEHLRWMQVLVLAGFQYDKDNNVILRHHDCLIPFSDPSFIRKDTIRYDIDSLRALHLLN